VTIRFTQTSALEVPADALAFGVGSDLAGFDSIEAAFGPSLRAHVSASGFTGAAGTACVLPGLDKVSAQTLILVGTGDGSTNSRRLAAGKAGREAREQGATTLALALGSSDDAALMAEVALSGNYAFDKYKPEGSRNAELSELVMVCNCLLYTSDAADALTRGYCLRSRLAQ